MFTISLPVLVLGYCMSIYILKTAEFAKKQKTLQTSTKLQTNEYEYVGVVQEFSRQ